uniref:Dehydrogenase/reductase SDR family member 7B n=1 Tax=Cyanistes caeruleus TaxID=156563 RepID=A0A8C0VM16_CYACU
MDFTSTVIIPLLFGSLGIFALFRLLQWVRMRAYLQEAVVVITGASSGLGKECAKAFHAAGSKLVLCGRDSEKLKELVQELCAVKNHRKNTHEPHTVVFDLSDTKTVVNAAEEILKALGHVDILINNAGISFRGTIVDTGLDVDKKVMETNYFGPIALTKALLPSMIKRRQGHIVAISSVQGKISIPFRSAYAASKHATQAFFDCLRAEVEQYDIEVTVVSPGYIQTNLSLNAVTADGSRYGGFFVVAHETGEDSLGLLLLHCLDTFWRRCWGGEHHKHTQEGAHRCARGAVHTNLHVHTQASCFDTLTFLSQQLSYRKKEVSAHV